MVAWWANVDKSNFQLVCRRSRDHAETQQRSEHYRGQFDEVLHLQFPPVMVRIFTGAIVLNVRPEMADPNRPGR